MRHSSFWLLLVLTAGCSTGRHTGSWAPDELIVPGNLPPEQQMKIWSGDTVLRWHAVSYTRDSITGIHYKMPVTCDSCRITLPRSVVDSVRLRHVTTPRDGRLMVEYVALGLLALAIARVP